MGFAIEVDGISKKYNLGVLGASSFRSDLKKLWRRGRGEDENSFWALNDITFRVSAGEAVGVIGRNGAGKSTLLKILSQITKPSKGKAVLSGRVGALLEVGTGFHPELTGRENVFLNGAILGMSRSEISRKLDEIVDFSGVEKYLDTPVKRYSSGMKVRLGFSVAAHLEPEILIVDEVLAVGDYLFQKKCLGKLEEVGGEGRTVLFVSHNLNLINKFCPRSILLDSGCLIKDGSTADVISEYVSRDSGDEKAEYRGEWRPGEKVFVRSACLVGPHGCPTSKITLGEKAKVILSLDFVEALRGVHIALIVTDKFNNHFYSVADTDKNKTKFEMKRKGEYRYSIDMPFDILNEGEFIISCGIGVPGGESFFRKELFSFSVLGIMSGELNVEAGRRAGLLYVDSNWECEK